MNIVDMINRNLVFAILMFLFVVPAKAQTRKQEPGLKREITLYNPYKPSLPEFKKRSFLPEMNDTLKISPDIIYEINTIPFSPEYVISPLKPASLLPDPLPRLYKSFVNLGLGNYNSPLAEISIASRRSKKGAIGFYGRHYSTNSNIKLDNDLRTYAGYMDNDVSLFGKKFFRKSLVDGSIDFSQKLRHAYGFDTIAVYPPMNKKDTRFNYNNIGANIGFASSTSDSSRFSYDFDLSYNYFTQDKYLFSHNTRFSGKMAKSFFSDFYAGAETELDFYQVSDSIWDKSKYFTSVSPFISKNTRLWNFKAGFQAMLERNTTNAARLHIYPDINFGFSIVPSYIQFYTGLGGFMEKNTPRSVIGVNPYVIPDGRLYNISPTDNELVVFAGLKGNTGIEGNYVLSATYSVVNDMNFFHNWFFPDTSQLTPDPANNIPRRNRLGNNFNVLTDDGEVLNLHGEVSGRITGKISFIAKGDYFKYTLADQAYAWNKPDWQTSLSLKYNLRDKILAGAEFVGTGSRKHLATRDIRLPEPLFEIMTLNQPAHLNLNLSAEYRYTKILSFWVKLNNVSYRRYYEWAFYPSQRFMGMVGFTYSL